MKKILISGDFGAGWSTWNWGEVGKYMLTYQPIIDFLEAGGEFGSDEVGSLGGKIHPLLQQLRAECLEKFGVGYVCVLGADDGLRVETVYGPFKIHEYDGAESLQFRDDEEWESAED